MNDNYRRLRQKFNDICKQQFALQEEKRRIVELMEIEEKKEEEREEREAINKKNQNWIESNGSHFSYHISVKYLGEDEPKYHVLQNPKGEGWIIGVFYGFTGEYVPLEEEGEERLIFNSASEAKKYCEGLEQNDDRK